MLSLNSALKILGADEDRECVTHPKVTSRRSFQQKCACRVHSDGGNRGPYRAASSASRRRSSTRRCVPRLAEKRVGPKTSIARPCVHDAHGVRRDRPDPHHAPTPINVCAHRQERLGIEHVPLVAEHPPTLVKIYRLTREALFCFVFGNPTVRWHPVPFRRRTDEDISNTLKTPFRECF